MNRISVIIPVYNASKYLEKCINSVLKQTYPVFEIILINDGSTDDSGRICDSFAMLDCKIKVIHKVNEGVSKARNIGLDAATGDLISFVDADDCLESDMYDYLIRLLDVYQSDISHCGYKRMNENEELLNECSGTHVILEQNFIQAIDCMLQGQYFNGGLWNKLYKKEIVGTVRFNESLKNNEDVLFNAMVFQNAKKIVFGDETKYLYYEHSTSACNTISFQKQSLDSILAGRFLLNRTTHPDLKVIVSKWLFLNTLNKYKKSLIKEDLEEFEDLRMWLRRNYKNIVNLTIKDRINYNMVLYTPHLYKFVYLIYDKLRKPNWDPIK